MSKEGQSWGCAYRPPCGRVGDALTAPPALSDVWPQDLVYGKHQVQEVIKSAKFSHGGHYIVIHVLHHRNDETYQRYLIADPVSGWCKVTGRSCLNPARVGDPPRHDH